MRILMLNYEFPPLGGGASPVSYEIADKLSKNKEFDIDVVTMGFKGLVKYEKINKNLKVYRVKCWRHKKEICYPWEQLIYLILGYLKCRQLLKKNKYDICHCHFIIPTGILALKLKKKFGLNYIITSHGSDVPGYNKDRFVFLHKFTGFILRKVCLNAKKIISPSKYLKKLIIKKIDLGLNNKIIHIPNGIDTNKFSPQNKKKYIISTGRLLRRKGFQYLIKAVSKKNIGYSVCICGDGPMMNELKNLAKKSKTKIIFYGWIDNNGNKYKNLLEQASIYALISEKENASVALLEAMSAGCAIITADTTGCAETIGNDGFLAEPKNYLSIKNGILEFIKNEEKLKQYQKKARKRVEKNFNWDIVIKKYQNILSNF